MSKVALVTGGTGGIGSAVCKRLAAAGFKVISTYFEPEEQAKAWAEKQDFAVGLYHCNVSDYDSCVKLKQAIEADGLNVDVIVNNAGITRDAKFSKMTYDMWRAVLSTNLDSLFNISHQFVDGMTERGWGRIINISSVNGQKGQAGQTNYSAAKAGVHGFTMALAQEVVRKGVTVNTISPGYIGTEMVMAIREDVREKIVAQIPMQRLGKPEEIAAVANFLASDDAAFITGADFSANGGQYMH
ncbi:acetoacetyl-CoA reductase [Thiofilum flexile]|uniref:acetoacetyl-CoA reductase n=1 Tax=Thiofilum flexile TaxID=125627 RepID=UPI00036B2451|nr:acetoacetyl-CoA reductase [Thiofilum flexile]